MSWGKKIVYCLLWSVYTVAVFFAAAGMGGAFCNSQNLPYFYGLLSSVAAAVLLGGVSFALIRLAPGLTAYFEKKTGVRLTAEAALVVVFLTAGFVFRAENLESLGRVGTYYEIAEVSIDKNIPQITHGAVYLYVWLLHLVLLFLGNNSVFCIVLQALLQGIAAISLFFLIRKYIGSLTALVVLGFFACAPGMIQGGLTLSPDMLYLCLWAAAAWIVMKCGERQTPPFFLLAAVVSAILFYLDAAGALLFLLSLWMALYMQSARSGRLRRKTAAVLCCVTGFAAGFAGCAFADSYISGKELPAVLRAWGQLYQPESFQLPDIVGKWDVGREGFVLLGLLILGIYSFWFARERERMAACMLSACAVMLALCFGVFTEEMPGTFPLYLLLVLMAGIGLEQCFGRRVWKPRAVREDIDFMDESAPEEEDSASQQEPGEAAEFDFAQVDAAEAQEEQTREPAGEEAQISAQEVKYIENPLPLPKKHVKKTLDYDFPVSEDDDFDF